MPKHFVAALIAAIAPALASPAALAAEEPPTKPNIVVIMADDVGIWNIGAYHRGMMAGRAPNIDQIATEGAIFTDYYAQASCTAGRAAFITGQLPIRTGMTTVGQAGATIGLPAAAPTIAKVMKEAGYMTGQFGKNHLGDLNKFLPTVHGFDEFFGFLYHLDAMEDPWHPNYPRDKLKTLGPRNVVHSFATQKHDPTVEPRWGEVGKQRIIDKGELPPYPVEGVELNMETIDEVFLEHATNFIDEAQKQQKPFFLWLNPSRMHVFTHLPEKYQNMRNDKNGWSLQEAGMAQLDDIVGALDAHLDKHGLKDNTILVFTTDNGTQNFTWPDGGQTPFAGGKGMVTEGGFRSPMVIRWPGTVAPGTVNNEIMAGLDFLPTFAAAAGMPNIKQELLAGRKLDGTDYKVHLDGYDQTQMLAGTAPSKRKEIWYFAESKLGAARINDYKYTFLEQPGGWFGAPVPVNWPGIVNLRLDPFERTTISQSIAALEWWGFQFWRYVFVQEKVLELGKTFLTFPPMQEGATFNIDDIRKKLKRSSPQGQ
ncbi:arylsulfatase [Polycladidibacter hongkongensis]|uniref:arylsulfatase n=1 Tax=Polycladidibacter hongkongensis TaxID=1647556 RepID=UPI0008360256|nr:arylsulfatase [Pseudovibrio hongkongensis]